MAQDQNAANRGDILKHALLAELLAGCSRWQSLTYAETHAGAGTYKSSGQEPDKQHIAQLQRKVLSEQGATRRDDGYRYEHLLREWWNSDLNSGLYPGSVLQAAMTLEAGLASGQAMCRVTEACRDTCARLGDVLAKYQIVPRCAGFQDEIEWLTEADPLLLLVDPFSYARNADGLSNGKMDLGTLKALLGHCWGKRACDVGFWCAGPHSEGHRHRKVFDEALRNDALENRATLRSFRYGMYSMAVIGIGDGRQVVDSLPSESRWAVWLRSTVKEDNACRVTTAYESPNLFANLPTHLPNELITLLQQGNGVRIEKIVSTGHRSPDAFCYDQDQNEWVVVLKGMAKLEFEDRSVHLSPGDSIFIPAHTPHRVLWTSADEPTVWLAVFFG